MQILHPAQFVNAANVRTAGLRDVLEFLLHCLLHQLVVFGASLEVIHRTGCFSDQRVLEDATLFRGVQWLGIDVIREAMPKFVPPNWIAVEFWYDRGRVSRQIDGLRANLRWLLVIWT